jgi:hypothetical protein
MFLIHDFFSDKVSRIRRAGGSDTIAARLGASVGGGGERRMGGRVVRGCRTRFIFPRLTREISVWSPFQVAEKQTEMSRSELAGVVKTTGDPRIGSPV